METVVMQFFLCVSQSNKCAASVSVIFEDFWPFLRTVRRGMLKSQVFSLIVKCRCASPVYSLLVGMPDV